MLVSHSLKTQLFEPLVLLLRDNYIKSQIFVQASHTPQNQNENKKVSEYKGNYLERRSVTKHKTDVNVYEKNISYVGDIVGSLFIGRTSVHGRCFLRWFLRRLFSSFCLLHFTLFHFEDNLKQIPQGQDEALSLSNKTYKLNGAKKLHW